MRSFGWPRALGFAAVALVASGCGDDEVPKLAAACGHQIGGACIGAPQAPICNENVCTAGVTCEKVVSVSNDAQLAAAAAAATAGTCIAPTPGTYAAVALPGGVSVLGKGPDFVTIAGVALGAGQGATVRGMKITSGGIQLVGAMGAHIDSVRIIGSAHDGIAASGGSTFSAVMIDVDGSGRYAVSAIDAGDVSIEQSVITGAKGPGIWAQCAMGCDCAQKPHVDIESTLVSDNKRVGISLVGVIATLHQVDVTDHTEDTDFTPGGGISASACAEATATALHVLDNTSFGILIDNAKASIGAQGQGLGATVSRNAPGLWVQDLAADGSQPVELDSCDVEANNGVGLGVSGASKGIMFWNSAVTGTISTVVPVLENGSASKAEVGDGISWIEGSQLDIKGVTLSGNARQSILIDGEVAPGSSIAELTLSGGDEQKGVLQQNLPNGGMQPAVGSNAPAVTASMSEQFAVPRPPAKPSL